MANTKSFILDWSETGQTVYFICVRSVDSFRLDDGDGDFATSPADPYISFTEDSVLKGRYQLDESRVVWDDGEYTYAIYDQVGGSPAPVSDTIIGTGSLYIVSDTEVVLDKSVASLNDISTAEVNTEVDNALDTAIPGSPTAGSINARMVDLHDEAFGKWTVDPTGKTLTLLKADGITTLKVFDLTSTATDVPSFIVRTPQ